MPPESWLQGSAASWNAVLRGQGQEQGSWPGLLEAEWARGQLRHLCQHPTTSRVSEARLCFPGHMGYSTGVCLGEMSQETTQPTAGLFTHVSEG